MYPQISAEFDPTRKYSIYLRKIYQATSLNELESLKTQIERDPKITEGERHYLISLIGIRRKSIAEPWDIYEAEVDSTIEALPATDNLKNTLSIYLKMIAPMEARSIEYLRKKVLKNIAAFVRWLAYRRGRNVDVVDFDHSNLSGYEILQFLEERSRGRPKTKKKILGIIRKFGMWLVAERRIMTFPPKEAFRFKVEEEDEESEMERKLGHLRRLSELERIFELASTPTPRVEAWKLPLFRYYFGVLLCTGLRPSHALCLRIKDFEEGGWIEDILGREFLEVDSKRAVVREKKERGEAVTRKRPPSSIFIPRDLYDDLVRYWSGMGWRSDSYAFPLDYKTLERRMGFLERATGIPRLSLYDFRHTWATVIYLCSGHNVRLLRDLGGWRADSDVPLDHYVEIMTPEEALTIAERFGIFLPRECRITVEQIREGRKVVTPEEQSRLFDLVDYLTKRLKELEERIRELERRG